MSGLVRRTGVLVAVALLLLAATLSSAPGFEARAQAPASDPVQSWVSFYVNCPTSVSFAPASGASSCGNVTSSLVWSGIAQTVGSSQNANFYLAGASGGVRVSYSVKDQTSNATVVSGDAYGTMNGGSCSSPAHLIGNASTFTNSGGIISSGDSLSAKLVVYFTGTGTPALCAGGSGGSAIIVPTTIQTGSATPLLTTTISAGFPSQGVLGGFVGVSITYTSTVGKPLNVSIYGDVKNSAGSVVVLEATNVQIQANGQVTAFISLFNVSPGNYNVVIVAEVNGVPVSTSASAGVSL